jgi:hypothetical protein
MAALFSAALGLAGSVYGANKASKAQAASLAQQQYEFERNRELQGAQMALALDDRRLQQEENAYSRTMERINRRQTGDERRWQQGQFSDYQDRLLSERREVIERQILQDKEAARKAQFELEQYLQNRDLAQDERAEAMAALKQAQEIASGERDEDTRRLLEDRAKADIEREFVVQQYQQAQNTYAQERADQQQFRDLLMSRIDSAQNNSLQFAAQMGLPPEIEEITQQDFDVEYGERADEYLSDVDRAADRVASQAESTLVRRGMADSTLGDDTRRDLTRNLSDQYTKARRAAYDDAMKYISGKQGVMRTDRLDETARRKGIVDEYTGMQGMALNPLLQLPGVGTSTGQYNLLSALPTGIYDRSIASANDYQAPMSIGTGIYDNMRIGSQMSGYLQPGSAASTGFFNIGSGIYNPLGQTIGNPMQYMNGINNLSNQMLTASQANYANAQSNAYNAGGAVADAAVTFGNELGSWWSNRNKEDTTSTGSGP